MLVSVGERISMALLAIALLFMVRGWQRNYAGTERLARQMTADLRAIRSGRKYRAIRIGVHRVCRISDTDCGEAIIVSDGGPTGRSVYTPRCEIR